jgi:hypothetical protein
MTRPDTGEDERQLLSAGRSLRFRTISGVVLERMFAVDQSPGDVD